jgi:hypothetical protein
MKKNIDHSIQKTITKAGQAGNDMSGWSRHDQPSQPSHKPTHDYDDQESSWSSGYKAFQSINWS